MNGNYVKIDLNLYNNLRDFKRKMEKKHGVTIFTSMWGDNQMCVTTDEAVKVLTETNVKLQENREEMLQENIRLNNLVSSLRFENTELKSQLPAPTTLDDIKKMSIWQFMKWRKK